MAINVRPSIVTSGLVLNLDAANMKSYPRSGTTWRDLSGLGNNGTLTNGPTFSSANGGYINYDGTDDYADFGNIFNFTTQDFTFSHWIYFNSLTTTTVNQGPVTFYKGGFNNSGYYTQASSVGALVFVTNQIGAAQVTSTAVGAVAAGAWYCVTYTRTGSSIRLYVNGVDSTSSAGTHINPLATSNSFRIANYQNGFIYSNIRIASFLTYTKALTPSEVQQNYNATKTRFGLQ
jgi:hypothetical protein